MQAGGYRFDPGYLHHFRWCYADTNKFASLDLAGFIKTGDSFFDNTDLGNKGEPSIITKPFLEEIDGQATKSLRVDDLARVGEEGRGKRRYAPGSRKQTLIRGHPNGATLCGLYRIILH